MDHDDYPAPPGRADLRLPPTPPAPEPKPIERGAYSSRDKK